MKRSQEQAQQRQLQAREREEKFRRGMELFNAQRFFDAHEAWEEIWLQSPEPDSQPFQACTCVTSVDSGRGGSSSVSGK